MNKAETLDYCRSHDLTIEEVKACSVFAELTTDEAQEVIETLKLFTKITYDFYKKEAKKHGNTPENS